MKDKKYKGMTVNERLFVSGLLEKFDTAVEEKNKVRVIEILKEVDLDEDSIIPILESLQLT